jgi:hypothetical protein
MRAYRPLVSIRTLFALLVAFAVLCAPAFTRAGEAVAAVSSHHGQMMEAGHCTETPLSGAADKDKAPGKSCCISMCMAVAVAPDAPTVEKVAASAPAVSGLRTFHAIGLAELATPPPKLS